MRLFLVIQLASAFNTCAFAPSARGPIFSKALSMISYNDLQQKLPSNTVIDVVDGMATKDVVVSDVAVKAGVSLSQARKDVAALAAITRADIAVSSDGELIYQFPSNLKTNLAQNSAKFKLSQQLAKAWPTLFWGIRVTFGITLIASVLAVFSTIFFIQSSSSDDRDERRDRGGSFGGSSFSYIWGPSPFDFLYWNRPYGYYASPRYNDPEDMGFLTSVYSYVFGDGDPNRNLNENRLKLASAVIRRSNGAVTAEQLAPFCDDSPNPDDFDRPVVDESFVLPIVTALNGAPEVTDAGDIIYVFPELQTSMGAQSKQPSLVSASQREKTREAILLKKAGLPGGASTDQIRMFLNWNGIETRGASSREEIIRVLEEALPPLTSYEASTISDLESKSRDDVLIEREYQFSVAPSMNRILAGGLGVLNLVGVAYLGNLLGEYAMYGVRLPSYMGLVQQGYPFLLMYAILYNAIPAVRALWTNSRNEKISKRNRVRKAWKKVLEASSGGTGRLAKKLKAAATYAIKRKRLSADSGSNVYDTKRADDARRLKANADLDEFDRLLDEGNISKSN